MNQVEELCAAAVLCACALTGCADRDSGERAGTGSTIDEISEPTEQLLVSVRFQSGSRSPSRSYIDYALWGDGVVVWRRDNEYFSTTIHGSEVSELHDEIVQFGDPMSSETAYAVPDSSWWEIEIRSPGTQLHTYVWDQQTPALPEFVEAWNATRHCIRINTPVWGKVLRSDEPALIRFRATFPGFVPSDDEPGGRIAGTELSGR